MKALRIWKKARTVTVAAGIGLALTVNAAAAGAGEQASGAGLEAKQGAAGQQAGTSTGTKAKQGAAGHQTGTSTGTVSKQGAAGQPTGASTGTEAKQGAAGQQAEASTGTAAMQAAAAKSVDLSGLEALSDQFMKGRTGPEEPPGTAIVVVQDGRIVFQKGYGFADAGKKTLVDPEKTVFRVGSVTKAFTAAAIMKLAEQGKIDLKEDVQKYMGGIKLDNPFKTPVTIHDLLTHTSGFQVTVEPPETYTPDLKNNVSLKDFVEQSMPPVVREPGTAYMYDNFAFELLGLVVENVSGQSFTDYVAENIFRPLGMKHTEISITEKSLPQLATGYDAGNNAMPPYATTPTEMADGGMLMTAEDAAHFMIAQLNGGMYGDTRVWSEASIRKMQQFQTGIHRSSPDATYGFENLFDASKTGGLHVVGKGGDVPGYSSYMLLIPEKKIGIFLVHNKMGASTKLAWDWYTMFIDRYFPTSEQKPAVLSMPAEQLKRFEGTYSDLRMSMLLFRVSATGPGELTVEVYGQTKKLKQIDPLLFVDETGRMLAFKEERDGTISYLKYLNPVSYAGKVSTTFVDVDGKNEYAPYIGTLKAMGILRGAEGGRFHPRQPVTRAEITALMVRIMGATGVTLSKQPARYKDTVGLWAEREIETAAEAGFVQGITDTTFAPNKALTRQDAAMLLVRAFQRTSTPEQLAALPLDKIKLAQPGNAEADKAMKIIVAVGLAGPDLTMEDKETVDFRPNDPFTRQEAAYWFAQFIYKFIMGIG